MRVARILTAVALQGAQIIRIPKFGAELFKKCPIALLPLMSDFFFEMTLEVSRDSIVVEQRIVYVEQENQTVAHDDALSRNKIFRSGLRRLSPPLSPGAGQHLLRFFGTPSAGGVVGEVARRKGLPYVEHRSDHAPTGLDHVCPLE